MKLTEAQRRVLKALAGGDVILHIGGINARQWLRGTGKPVNWTTSTILLRAGLIESFYAGPLSADKDYRITALGRTVLREAGDD